MINLVVAGLYENFFRFDRRQESHPKSGYLEKNKPVIQNLESKMKSINTAQKCKMSNSLSLSKSQQGTNKLKKRIEKIIISTRLIDSLVKSKTKYIPLLNTLAYVFIITDSIILCIDGAGLDEQLLWVLSKIDYACLLIFYLEVMIRIALTPKFFSSFINLIDFFLFLLNVITEISLRAANVNYLDDLNSKVYPMIRSFHTLRIFRILINNQCWHGASALILELVKIIEELKDLLCILLVIFLVFTLMGRDLFVLSHSDNHHAGENEELERVNFTGFYRAFLANFLIFNDEEWHLIMFAHIETFSKTHALYFVANLLICTIFLNKLFLASLINKLVESKIVKKMIGHEKTNKTWHENPHTYCQKTLKTLKSRLKKLWTFVKKALFSSQESFDSQFEIRKKSQFGKSVEKAEGSAQSRFVRLQAALQKVTRNNKYFDDFMIFLSIFSLISLALYDPYQPQNSSINFTVKIIDISILVIFFLELIADIIVQGKKPNFLLIALKSLVCFILLLSFLHELHIMRILLIGRLFRLFLLFHFSKELKVAGLALLKSIGNILKFFFFFLLVSLVFALVGMKYFKGTYWSCLSIDEESNEKVITKADCFDLGGDWIRQDFNFDNIFKALELLFIIANTEGWLPLMYTSWDSVGIDLQPKKNHNTLWGIYYIIYGVMAHLFVLNIIIAILVEKYINSKNKLENLHLLTDIQNEWRTIQSMICNLKPKKRSPLKSKLQLFLKNLTKRQSYRYFFIFLNFLTLLIFSLIYDRQSEVQERTIYIISLILNIIFLLESIIEIVINSKTWLTIQPWCNLLLLLCSILLLFIKQNTEKFDRNIDFIKNLLVSVQTFRFFFLTKYVSFMKKLMRIFKKVVVKSIPIIFFFLIIWFSYGLLATQIFCYLKPQKWANSEDIRFSNILDSMFTLARIATIEQWYLILADVTRQQQANFNCRSVNDYDDFVKYGQNGCGTLWAYPFFYSFYLIILLAFNLLVGIIINLSDKLKKCEESCINVYQLKDITKVWGEFDQLGKGYINYKDFWVFSSRIAIILGVKIEELRDLQTKKRFLRLLDLPLYENELEEKILCFRFQEVLMVFSKISVMIKFNLSKGELESPDRKRFNIARGKREQKLFTATKLRSGQISGLIDYKSSIRKWRASTASKRAAEVENPGNRCNSSTSCCPGSLKNAVIALTTNMKGENEREDSKN